MERQPHQDKEVDLYICKYIWNLKLFLYSIIIRSSLPAIKKSSLIAQSGVPDLYLKSGHRRSLATALHEDSAMSVSNSGSFFKWLTISLT